MSVIADIFSLLWKLLTSLVNGEVVLVRELSFWVDDCPVIFAVYFEFSFIALLFMGWMLYKRREQRMMPVPPAPQMLIAPAPSDPLPPDYTLQKAIAVCVGAVLVLLALCSAF